VRLLRNYEIDGISLNVYDEHNSLSADWVAWELQRDEYRIRDIHFEAGDVVVDIGAHIGLFSIYLAKRWPGIKVIAFEPFPINFRNCRDNLLLNGVTSVVLSSKAISSDERVLNMAMDPRNSGGASAIVGGPDREQHAIDLESITLDQVFATQNIRRCKLLKIDCEGMEYEILFGCRSLVQVEYVVGEFHTNPYLTNIGYQPEQLVTYCSSFFKRDKMAISFNVI
jgi:FkbM family methyltransferase